jgi:hypothetical protein
LAEFPLKQRPLLGGDHRRDGGVIIRRQCPVVGYFDADAVFRIRRNCRHQYAGLALDRRIGRRKIRQIGHRLAEKFEAGVLEIDHLLALVVNDAGGFDLPQRRLLRVVLARRAGGVDAVMQDGDVAARALGAGRGHAGLIRRLEPKRVDEAVAVVVRQIHDLAVADLAVLLAEPDVAFGVQPLGGLVVDDLVGFDGVAAIVDLHAADGGDTVVGVVVIDLARLHEHLLLPGFVAVDGDLGFRRRRRRLREGQLLRGRGRRHQGRREQAAACQSGKNGSNRCGAPAVRPRRWWTRAIRPRHHPSSWYNNAINPVSPPASTGNQAAATGCISSALLRSSVTFDKT